MLAAFVPAMALSSMANPDGTRFLYFSLKCLCIIALLDLQIVQVCF
ncbi:hypothetical protein INQ16_29020 [Escherichia coli]|nr:hypothetical protein [Escherichia coli]